MNSETVHLISSIFWGLYGLSVGTIGLIVGHFNVYVMVTIVSAIAGNSAHLISMSYSKGKLEVQSQK